MPRRKSAFAPCRFFHRLDHLEGRPNVRELVDFEKRIHRDGWLKVADFGHVHDGVTEHMHARIDGVTKEIADLIDRHGEWLAWLFSGWGTHITALVQEIHDLLLGLPIRTKLERLLYQNPILSVRAEVVIRVFVVAMRSNVDRFTLL
jgi:hypothetical protein